MLAMYNFNAYYYEISLTVESNQQNVAHSFCPKPNKQMTQQNENVSWWSF